MPVVDFHLHAYDLPIRGPISFVQFMERQIGHSFEKFMEEHSTGASYLNVLDQAGVDYGIVLPEVAPITSVLGSNEHVARLCKGSSRLIPFASINPYQTANPDRELERLVTETASEG